MSEFYCDACNVSCAFKSDYDRHISSQRHAKREKQKAKNLADTQCECCGKRYKFASSLSFHRKTCAKAQAQQAQAQQSHQMQLVVHDVNNDATVVAAEKKEPLSEEEDQEDLELFEVEIKGKTYVTNDETNGDIYEYENDEVGEIVGTFKNGVAKMKKPKSNSKK